MSRATLRSNLQEPTSSRGINRRNSSFALPSSPHLYKAPVTYEPYIQPSGTTHLLARLLNIQIRQTAPTPQLFCLQLPRISAIQEIRSILRDWRRYGLYNVRVNQEAGTVRATVSEDNGFDMKPVSLVATIHAVAVDGNAGGLSIVKVTAEWGNRNSFQKACEALNVVLRDRNLIVMSRHVAREMKAALRDWEKM